MSIQDNGEDLPIVSVPLVSHASTVLLHMTLLLGTGLE